MIPQILSELEDSFIILCLLKENEYHPSVLQIICSIASSKAVIVWHRTTKVIRESRKKEEVIINYKKITHNIHSHSI